jgi:hypothetical protein
MDCGFVPSCRVYLLSKLHNTGQECWNRWWFGVVKTCWQEVMLRHVNVRAYVTSDGVRPTAAKHAGHS